jgi:integrase
MGRAKGDGTLYWDKKRRCYFVMVTYRDPISGETKRKKLKGAEQKTPKGESASLKIGQEWLKKIENGLLPDADKITLWEWLSRWLQDYAKPRLRVKSFDKYESCLRLYVKPTLGDVTMLKLKAADIRRLLQRLLTEGGREITQIENDQEVKKSKGLASLTVRNTRRYLIMALDQAVKEGLLMRNVARDVDPPKLVKKEIRPLTKEQATALTEAAKQAGEMPYMAILLALSTGARLGELFGLKWDCVDLEKGVIYIKRSIITSHGSKYEFQEPKTAKSRRQIPLPVEVVKELRKYKKWQEWHKNLIGDKYLDNDLVLASVWGRVVETSNFTSKVYKGILEQAGISKTVKFHDLRHTHATLLLQQGVNPKVVQERLGHSTISMTLDTYSHVLPDMQDTAVKALEGLFVAEK